MATRRSHTKSRNGCLECKRRKVKCDESPAICLNCKKRNHDCSFSEYTPVSPPSSNSAQTIKPQQASNTTLPTSSISESGEKTLNEVSLETLFKDDLQDFPVAPDNLPQSHLFDLELIHYYTIELCPSSAKEAEVRQIWQVDMMKEAFRHEFLMRAILSLSAVHKIHTTGDFNKWASIARTHQQSGLRKVIPVLTQLTEENCHAVFAFSVILAILSVASPMSVHTGAHVSPVDKAIGLFVLLRGVNTVIGGSWAWIASGRIGLLLRRVANVTEGALSEDTMIAFKRLRAVFETSIPLSNDGETTRKVYLDASLALEKIFQKVKGDDVDVDVILGWSYNCGDGYMAFLQQRRVPALALLAYYGVLLHQLRNEWWIKGWGRQLVETVCQELSSDWRDAVTWALEQTEK